MTNTQGAFAPTSMLARLMASAAVALCLMPVAAAAQDQPAGTADENEIVVTAQRRAERLIDVPIAITAISSETLDARNISNVSGLSGLAPNVTILTYYSTSPQIAIRGSATTNPSPAFEPTTALYLDGVYQGKQYASGLDVADIEQVEVLRGPQGTLYGRNTLAGAINITTKKPTGEFGGNIKIGGGDYAARLVNFNVNLPAFGDFKVKLSGLYDAHDGYIKVLPNPFANVAQARTRTNKRMDAQDKRAFRAAVRFDPTPDFTADYTFDYGRQRNIGKLFQLIGYGRYNPATYDPVRRSQMFDPASPSYAGGLVAGTYYGYPMNLYVQPGGRADTTYASGGVLNRPLDEKLDVRAHSLTLAHDAGPTTLKSISSYRTVDADNQINNTGTPLPLLNSQLQLDFEQFSQEFQATGEIGELKYTGGLFYYHDDARVTNPIEFFTTTVVDSRYRTKTDAYAAYGQIEYAIGALTLTGGLRYSHEKKTIDRSYVYVGTAPTAPGNIAPGSAIADDSFSAFTPTFIARYTFNDDFNVYAKYAQGFKSGGFNAESSNAATATTSYRPEKVKSYEVGLKAKSNNGRIQFNAAAFLEDHSDQQLSIFRGTGVSVESTVQNAGRSRIKGFELEVVARPADRFTISANLGYLSGKYKEFLEIDYDTQVYGNYADQRALTSLPKFSGAINADLQIVESDGVNVHLLADYRHSDKYFNYAYSTVRGASYDAYTTRSDTIDQVDMRLRATDIAVGSSTLEASLWVRNIFDSTPRVWGIDYGPQFGNYLTALYAPPRTIGGDLTFRF
jgi:iron complex outermembrane receptor protein